MKIQKILNKITSKQVFYKKGETEILYYHVIGIITAIIGFSVYGLSLYFNNIDTRFIFSFLLSAPITCYLGAKYWTKVFNRNSNWYSFFGGFLGIMISIVLFTYIFNQDFLRVCDTLILFSPLIHSIGRFACINNGCCIYRERKTKGLYFKYNTKDARANKYGLKGKKLYPAHLYEIGLNILLFLLMFFVFMFSTKRGGVFSTYLIGYGLIRLNLEKYRKEKELPKYTFCLVTLFILTGGLILIC